MSTCKTCGQPTVGKSKYCREHREAARAAFLNRISEGKAERAMRDKSFEELHARAVKAGMAAAELCIPRPMTVTGGGQTYHIPDGVCGFAWVNVRPGNCAFANWLKRNGHARSDSYAGGVCIWIGAYDQSMERKSAHAQAYARVISEAGIKAYASSRMD